MLDKLAERLIRRRRDIAQAYRDVFGSPSGQLVLQHLAEQNFVLTPTFVSGDPMQTNLHEGQRRVVLSIMRYVAVDAERVLTMIEEKADVQSQ